MWFDTSFSDTVILSHFSHVALCIVFLAQNLKYSVKNDVGLVVFDMPGKASERDIADNLLFVFIRAVELTR